MKEIHAPMSSTRAAMWPFIVTIFQLSHGITAITMCLDKVSEPQTRNFNRSRF